MKSLSTDDLSACGSAKTIPYSVGPTLSGNPTLTAMFFTLAETSPIPCLFQREAVFRYFQNVLWYFEINQLCNERAFFALISDHCAFLLLFLVQYCYLKSVARTKIFEQKNSFHGVVLELLT